MTEHRIRKEFVSVSSIGQLVTECDSFIQKHYNEKNIEAHIAYPSDRSESRDSYAFPIGISEHLSLPHIPIEMLPDSLAATTSRVCDVLDVDMGRVLFNIQRYKSGASRVPKHIDGEIFKFELDAEKNLVIHRMVRPKQVALLTLINNVDGGGTRLFPDGSVESMLISYDAGRPADL